VETITLHLPVHTRNFTDYLCSAAHIQNAGQAMRGTVLPPPPSFLNLPIGYAGHASSLIVSGTDIVRPKGLVKAEKDGEFVFASCTRLDYELEVGVIIGKASTRGKSVESAELVDYIFGLVLVNDWSGELLCYVVLLD
jgi:fumarylacetoacetase